MINLSLDMFRMERGSYPFTPKPVDLRDVLGKVVRDIEHHARAKRVALRIEGPPLHALAEELLCYSMFGNLAKNALEASPEGGTVTLSLAENGESVLVEVRNAGAVPEAVRARFFDKYSTAGKHGGSGLGTYSARLMALTQKGDIGMQTGEAGTTLRVRLMRAAAEAQAVTAKGEKHAAQNPPTDPGPLSVLVVDDDEYTRVFVQRFLPRSMRTRSAANGREAVDSARQDPPDVIIMDLDMPVMGGLEAAALIRRREAESGGAHSAMIAMSSHDDPAMPARSLEAGFDRFVAKPVSPEALQRAIAELSRAKEPVLVDADLADALPGFLASRREMVAELSQALAAGSAEPARALAHKLAGSLALYGFQWAAEQSKMIEKRAREGRLEGLAGEVAALSRYLEGVRVGFAANREAEAKA
jgi:CheY-like chemotaxis protein